MPILYVIIFIPQKSVKNLFLVRQRGFKLAFPDGEGARRADRVDYHECARLYGFELDLAS